ncbi:MAG: hypothetical protein A2293_07565 [Elusimicrobia bacterium RIFOXYB2_FULL_49_7]|nr:MAG: hypothetical protein A2293_07565 [Elusimicrobia bacterium RIFOXYB2_FULL_49_7]
MIMNKLRSGDFVKWVMYIVIGTFVGSILFAWGMDIGGSKFGGQKMTIGKIGDKVIPYPQFNEELNNRLRSERRENEMSLYKAAKMREDLFQQMVAQAILDKEIKSLNLKGSSDELIQYFHKNPPPGLSENPYFQTDSVFDTSKYYQFLDSPEAYNIPGMSALEAYAANFTIPANQLQALILNSVKVTDLEARDQVVASQEKADVEYLFLPSKVMPVDSAGLVEKEVAQYYKTHSDSFRTEGMAEVQYVSLPKQPTPADDEAVKTEMENLYQRLMSGDDFGALAMEWSDDGSAKDSGDLGSFGRGNMVKPFEEVAFSLKQGEISKPFKSPFGYHIVQVTEIQKKEDKVRARHILRKVEASPATIDVLRAEADSLLSIVKEGRSLKELADARQLAVSTTGLFEKGASIPGFDGENRYLPGLKSLAFNTEEKTAEVLENDGAFYVAVVIRSCKAGTAPSEFVTERIKNSLMLQKKEKAALEKMETVLKTIHSENLPLSQVPSHFDGVQYYTQNDQTRLSFLPGLGAASTVMSKAFSLPEGGLSEALLATGGAAIIRLVKKTPLTEEQIVQAIPSMRRNLNDQARYRIYSDWFETRRKAMTIVNNLETFYQQ